MSRVPFTTHCHIFFHVIFCLFSTTVNSPIKVHCVEAGHYLKSRARERSNITCLFFFKYRHVIYCWQALELIFWNLKRGVAPLLGVCFEWRIYGIFHKPFCFTLVFLLFMRCIFADSCMTCRVSL